MRIEKFARAGCHFVLLIDFSEQIVSGGVFHTDEDANVARTLLTIALIRAGVALPLDEEISCTGKPTKLQDFMSELDEKRAPTERAILNIGRR